MALNLYDLVRLNFTIYPGVKSFRSATFLRAYYEGKQDAGSARRLFNLALFACFQLWVPVRARFVARRWGKDSGWVRRTVRICRARFADPNDIALFRIEDAAELDHYMRRFEHIGVGRAISYAETDHSDLMLDKGRFYELCQSRGLPHPPVFATLEKGRTSIWSVPQAGQQVFIKPARGSGGKGTAVAVFRPGLAPEIEFRRLVGALAKRRRGDWIVQPRLRAHLSIRDIAGDALPTVRVVTLLNEHDAPEIVSTVLRLSATDDAIVDNIGVGGLSVPVVVESGLLGPGCGGMQPGEFAHHPRNGALIEGRTLPDWPTITGLALSTHRDHFRDHVMIGWDIGVAEDGPCLLEANARPSIIMTQRAARMPVGRTRMGILISYHLEQRKREGKSRQRLLVG